MEQPSAPDSSNRPVKIVVADGHPVIRKMVTQTLKENPRFEVIAEAKDGLEAIEKVVALKPDAVVLNVILPVLNGFDAARRIRKSSPEVAIVVLSTNADRQFIEEARKIGVRAYVPKSEAAIALVKAVEAAIGNDEFFVVE
jgi:DNA-binding NarL/FixJ family response regulator